MIKGITLAALLIASCSVQAQAVYKCRDAAGKVEFTSSPCSRHQRTEKVVSAIPEPVRPYQPTAYTQQQTGSNVFNNGYQSPPAPNASQRCSNAKAWRESELKRLGLRRRFDDLRRIDDWVSDQCPRG